MQKISEHGNFEIDGDIYDQEDILNLIYLQSELLLKENMLCSIEECADIWHGYSNDLHASWLCFPENVEDYLTAIKGNSYFVSFEYYLKCEHLFTTKNKSGCNGRDAAICSKCGYEPNP